MKLGIVLRIFMGKYWIKRYNVDLFTFDSIANTRSRFVFTVILRMNLSNEQKLNCGWFGAACTLYWSRRTKNWKKRARKKNEMWNYENLLWNSMDKLLNIFTHFGFLVLILLWTDSVACGFSELNELFHSTLFAVIYRKLSIWFKKKSL